MVEKLLTFIQGRNELALVHAATAFAKHSRGTPPWPWTASIGPGVLNMVTGAALPLQHLAHPLPAPASSCWSSPAGVVTSRDHEHIRGRGLAGGWS